MSTYLIVGLGNPGSQYAQTRHNVGFMALDRLAERYMLQITGKKFKGHFVKGVIRNKDVVLLQPQTFMNLSGGSVQPAAAFYDIEPERIIVVHDELDLECGDLRVKKGGGPGGHNGLRDIIQKLGERDFIRIRMGIGRPSRGSVTDWVLGTFPSADQSARDEMIEEACDALETILTDDVITAQNRFNGSSR